MIDQQRQRNHSTLMIEVGHMEVFYKSILFNSFRSFTFLTILGNIQINIFSCCLRHYKVQNETFTSPPPCLASPYLAPWDRAQGCEEEAFILKLFSLV